MSNKEKKISILRLVLFCVLAFLPLYVITPILNASCGELIFSENISGKTAVITSSFGLLAMFAPTVAHLLTRLFTREGFKNTYLGLYFKGNARYYIASVSVKLLEATVAMFLIWAVFIKGASFSDTFLTGEWQLKTGTFLLQLSFSIILFFPAFGEEWGWRGYMMPKLMELMPKPLAILVGGIIWGLWHAPLTVSGHNFGTEYKFYPWLGILLMCLYCVLMNAFLTLLTKRTKSIYPASFCHMVNNNLGAGIMLSIFAAPTVLEKQQDVSAPSLFLLILCITAITGVVSFVLLMRKKK